MKLLTSLVAVKKITTDVARSSFSAEDIERVAHLILEVEGTINPIILRRTSLESYEVVSGNFEYYAAVRAREISLLKGEMIQAVIITPENEQVLLEQVDRLRKNAPLPSLQNANDGVTNTQLANLEKIFQLQFEELRKENRSIQQSINDIAKKPSDLGLSDQLIEKIAQNTQEIITLINKKSSSMPKNKSIQDLEHNPLDINTASKNELETVPGIGSKKAIDIIARRETKKFIDVSELSEISGISEAMIGKYQWSKCFKQPNS